MSKKLQEHNIDVPKVETEKKGEFTKEAIEAQEAIEKLKSLGVAIPDDLKTKADQRVEPKGDTKECTQHELERKIHHANLNLEKRLAEINKLKGWITKQYVEAATYTKELEDLEQQKEKLLQSQGFSKSVQVEQIDKPDMDTDQDKTWKDMLEAQAREVEEDNKARKVKHEQQQKTLRDTIIQNNEEKKAAAAAASLANGDGNNGVPTIPTGSVSAPSSGPAVPNPDTMDTKVDGGRIKRPLEENAEDNMGVEDPAEEESKGSNDDDLFESSDFKDVARKEHPEWTEEQINELQAKLPQVEQRAKTTKGNGKGKDTKAKGKSTN